jgi:hypothetical protein
MATKRPGSDSQGRFPVTSVQSAKAAIKLRGHGSKGKGAVLDHVMDKAGDKPGVAAAVAKARKVDKGK